MVPSRVLPTVFARYRGGNMRLRTRRRWCRPSWCRHSACRDAHLAECRHREGRLNASRVPGLGHGDQRGAEQQFEQSCWSDDTAS